MVHAFSKITLFTIAAIFMLGIAQVPSVSLAQSSMKSVQKKTKKKIKRRDTGQDAIVIVDGSAVYQAQNFDAPVMEYLDRGKKIKISKKVYPGIGGLGTFYKIRIKKGVYGYITDVDIEISGKSGVQATQNQMQNGNEISNDPLVLRDDLENDTGVPNTGDTVYLTRFFGVSISSMDYTETIAGKAQSSTESLFGFKLSGPGKWMGGLPLDIEVQILTSTPAFYDKFSASSSGYMLLSHVYAMFPVFIDTPRHVLYYQFGPTLKYAAFDVLLNNASPQFTADSQEIALGANLGFGYALRLGQRWALRFETNFTYENESYASYGAAIQMRY